MLKAVRSSILLAFLVLFFVPLVAQAPPVDVREEVFAGSELEGYLRYLQTLRSRTELPWSVRGLSGEQVERLFPADSLHPWASRFHVSPDTTGGVRFGWVRPSLGAVFNSTFPHGGNDGPVWMGRGLTTTAQGGFFARYGPVALTVAPRAFWAQNSEFDLAPNGRSGVEAFRDGRFPGNIDLPQRFGDQPYARLDFGESTLRVDLFGLAAGISTAGQIWGPADEYPLLLSNHAGGFPHAFAGTSLPLDVGIGTLHGRLVWGRLDQSDWSPASGEGRRFMSGAIAVLSPRGVDGLELGIARFFHTVWPQQGLGRADFLKPLEGFLKEGLENPDQRAENQLASAFARWVLPETGFEVFGEFVREDHSGDLRHFVLEPDDLSGYMLGLRRAWKRDDLTIVGLRAELMNTQPSHREREDRKALVPLYLHHQVVQGHTLRGQLLAAGSAYGGAASVVGADFYHPGGRWTLEWQRALQQERTGAAATESEGPIDVVHSVRAERLWFSGRWELLGGLSADYRFNRNFAEDAFNLKALLQASAAF